MDLIVPTAWLADHLANVKLLDATLLDPALGRDAAAEFAAGHIPGARFLDLATLVDPASDLPNALPPAALVAERLGGLGVSETDRIVVYDHSPWRSAARAWWLLRLMGAREVAVLDGGMGLWRAEGRPLETGIGSGAPARFDARLDAAGVRDLSAMRTTGEQVVDARSAARFAGAEPETRPGVAAGHIPGSRNLPYSTLFEADGRMKPPAALAQTFNQAGIDPARPTVATCGSGITAAVLVLAAARLGHDMALYDGSWSEWGADPTTAKATA